MAPAIIRDQSGGTEHGAKEVTILVTGFSPFLSKYPINPSYEVARRLPEFLPSSPDHKTAVRIISYGSPIKVSYDEVRNEIPLLLERYQGSVDLVLHFGMASERSFYTLERYAHRDGYQKNKDVNGRMPPRDEGQQLFEDCPRVMTTSLDYADILHRWQSNIVRIPEGSSGSGADCRPSDDAGSYLCDYIYFNSLAYFGRKNESCEGGSQTSRPVLFMHVPAESDEDMLKKGRAVAIASIRGMVDSFSKKAEVLT